MKKIAVLLATVALGFVVVPIRAAGNITSVKSTPAAKGTTNTYAGVPVFVPAGQTVVLESSSKDGIVLKGQNLKGVKVGDGTISVPGPVVFLVQPSTQAVRIIKGNGVKITDSNGRTVELSAGASVSMKDIRQHVRPFLPAAVIGVVQTQKITNVNKSKDVALDEDINAEILAFVEAAETSIVTLEPKARKNRKTK